LLHYTVERPHANPQISAIVDIVLGILLLLLVFFRHPKPKTNLPEQAPSTWKQFVTGFGFMVIDLSTLVLYFAALKMVFDAKLNFAENTVLIIAIIIIAMSTMVLPVLLATVFPHSSARILEILNRFITKHGTLINKIIVFLIAIYIIYKGVHYFL